MLLKVLKNKVIILSLISIFLLYPAIAFSQDQTQTKTCIYKCPKGPYELSHPFSRGLQQVSGLNFLATKFAESQIKKHLKTYVGGDVNVDIDSFSAMDLASGKLKKLEINALDVDFDDVYISSIYAKNVCDFIHIDYKAKPVALVESLNIEFKGVLTEEDLNKTVSNQKYLDKITKINLNNNSKFSFIKLNDPKVNLLQDRMILSANLWFSGTPESMVIPIQINTGLKANSDKVEFSDIQLHTGFFNIKFNLPPQAFESINPILYNLNELTNKGDRKNKINFEKVTINDKQIDIEGSLWLPKSNRKNTINKENENS